MENRQHKNVVLIPCPVSADTTFAKNANVKRVMNDMITITFASLSRRYINERVSYDA